MSFSFQVMQDILWAAINLTVFWLSFSLTGWAEDQHSDCPFCKPHLETIMCSKYTETRFDTITFQIAFDGCQATDTLHIIRKSVLVKLWCLICRVFAHS